MRPKSKGKGENSSERERGKKQNSETLEPYFMQIRLLINRNYFYSIRRTVIQLQVGNQNTKPFTRNECQFNDD